MEPVYFVMAILGCGDDGGQCSRQRVEPVRYASAIECQAAMPEALARNTDLNYPVLSAACERRGEQIAGTGPSRSPAPRS